jgi:hypothetical protein
MILYFAHLLVFTGKAANVVRKNATRYVVGGCSNTRNIQEGIALHTIPFYGDDRPEAKKRRKRRVDFVKAKRAKWEPSKSSVICSKHFKPDDFARRLDVQEENGILLTSWLKRDEFGITAFPSIHAAVVASEKQQSVSGAEREILLSKCSLP